MGVSKNIKLAAVCLLLVTGVQVKAASFGGGTGNAGVIAGSADVPANI